MDITWEDIRLFLAVAETGSLTAAGKQLRLGQSTVSRRLADLEERLGHPLFRRQASGAVLTSEGERLLEPARRMAEWAGEFGRFASSDRTAPEGLVRIAAPPGVAVDFVAPFAGWLRTKHPGIRIEALSAIHYVDLARGEADLALRSRAPNSSDLTVLASLHCQNRVYVSQEYAAKLPKRYGFADLDWIAWSAPFEDLPPNPQLEALIPDFRPSFTSDNFLVHERAAEAGLGAIVRAYVEHRFSRPTNLVPLDLDLGPHATSSLHLVCAKSALDISRVRIVAELLTELLESAKT